MTYFGANAVLPAGSWGLPQVSEWTVRVHVHVHVRACVCSAEVLHQRMQRESRNYKLLPRARPHLNRPAGKARKRFQQRLTSPPKTTTTTHKKTHNLVGTWWGISEVIFFTKGFVKGLIDRKNCPRLTPTVG